MNVLNTLKKVLRNPVTVRIIASQTGLTQGQVRGLISKLTLPKAKKKGGKKS